MTVVDLWIVMFGSASTSSASFAHAGILQVLVGRVLREHLGEPGGPAAQPVFLLDQRHLVARRGSGLRGRHAGDAAADHHQILVGLLDQGLRRLDGRDPAYAHADVIFGQHLGVFVVRSMGPGHVLAQVHPVGQHLVPEVEQLGEHPLRTRRHHDAVQPLAIDVRLDQLDTFATAEDVVCLAERSLGLAGGDFGQLVEIDRFRDVAAFADIDADLGIHGSISWHLQYESFQCRAGSILNGGHDVDGPHRHSRADDSARPIGRDEAELIESRIQRRRLSWPCSEPCRWREPPGRPPSW